MTIIVHFIIMSMWLLYNPIYIPLPSKETEKIKHEHHNNFPAGTDDSF